MDQGPAAFGAPTEPAVCPLCGERPGTVRLRNLVAVPEGEIPAPRPDAWACLPCAQASIRQGLSRQASEWQTRIDAEPRAARRAQFIKQAARVAAAIRSQLRALQAEPDESTAAFLERYGVWRVTEGAGPCGASSADPRNDSIEERS